MGAEVTQRTKPEAFSMTEGDRIVLKSAMVLRGTNNKSQVMREAIHYYAKRLRQEAESARNQTDADS